jgi:hypothetical protein
MGTGAGARITRRALLAGSGALGVSIVLPVPLRAWAAAAAPGATDPVTSVLGAYVSTLVPGPTDDPEGTPGAVEAGAVEELQAHVPYVIPLIVADVEAVAVATYAKPFDALGYPEREAILVDAFADPARAAHHLVALAIGAGAFYADFRSRIGGLHMGFPGPSDGYLDTYTDRDGHGQPQALAIPA